MATVPPLSGTGRFDDSTESGYAFVSEGADPTDPNYWPLKVRTVEYHNYVNEDGMVLNWTGSIVSNASQTYRLPR